MDSRDRLTSLSPRRPPAERSPAIRLSTEWSYVFERMKESTKADDNQSEESDPSDKTSALTISDIHIDVLPQSSSPSTTSGELAPTQPMITRDSRSAPSSKSRPSKKAEQWKNVIPESTSKNIQGIDALVRNANFQSCPNLNLMLHGSGKCRFSGRTNDPEPLQAVGRPSTSGYSLTQNESAALIPVSSVDFSKKPYEGSLSKAAAILIQSGSQHPPEVTRSPAIGKKFTPAQIRHFYTKQDVDPHSLAAALPTKRKTMFRINEYLFVGNMAAASNDRLLCKFNIEYLVNVADFNHSDPDAPRFHYMYNFPCTCKSPHARSRLSVPLPEKPNHLLRIYFQEINDFISRAKSKGKSVLVHNPDGKTLHLVASTIIQYLIRAYGMTLDEASQAVKEEKPDARPNEHYFDYLMHLDEDHMPPSHRSTPFSADQSSTITRTAWV